jgi:O-antigen/teichoic acid export membrane protein
MKTIEIARNSIYLVCANVSSKAISFATLTILARNTSVEDFGLYNMITAIALSVCSALEFGLSTAVQRAVSISKAKPHHENTQQMLLVAMKVMFGSCTFLMLLLAALVAGYSLNLFSAHFAGEYAHAIPILLIALFMTASIIPNSIILGMSNFSGYAIRLLIINSCTLLLIPSIGHHSGPYAAAYGFALCQFVGFAMAVRLATRLIDVTKVLSETKLDVERARFNLKQCLIYYFGNTFVGAVYGITILSLIHEHLGLVKISYLGLGTSLAALASFLPAAIGPVIISGLSSQSSDELLHQKSLSYRVTLLVSTISSMLLIAFSGLLIPILFGDKYTQGITIIAFVLALNFLMAMNGLLVSMQSAAGYFVRLGWLAAMFASINLLLSLITIPLYGMVGYFVCNFLTYALSIIINGRMEFFRHGYADRRRIVFASLLAFSCIALILSAVLSGSGLTFILLQCICSLILLCLAAMSAKEFESFRKAVKHILLSRSASS